MPLNIVLYLVGFGFPALRLRGVPTSPFVLGTAAIVLTYSACVAEVFRAGIESVHPSQRAAARSLGLTHRQTMRIVVLPQALRTVTPALLNDFVAPPRPGSPTRWPRGPGAASSRGAAVSRRGREHRSERRRARSGTTAEANQ